MTGSQDGGTEVAASTTATLGRTCYCLTLLKDQHTTLQNARTGSSCLPWELLKSTFLHTFHIPSTSRSCFLWWPASLPLPTYILSCGSHMLIVSPLTKPNVLLTYLFLRDLQPVLLLMTCPSKNCNLISFEFLSQNSIPLRKLGAAD